MTHNVAERSNDARNANGTVVTVGTFDGVHRGHVEVLNRLDAAASARDAVSVLVTFDPHPLRIVRPEAAPPLLTTPAEKIEILAQTRLDRVVFLHFTPVLASYEPRQFVEQILIDRLNMRHLVIGYDHGFGRGRSGDVDTLRQIARDVGFGIEVVEAVETAGEHVSSSLIRQRLQEGAVREAGIALGRHYSLTGTVVRGEGQGRKLGFPTANLGVDHADKLIPHEGIYAVRAALRDRFVDGVLHLGPRPTFAGLPPSIELHLFDFDTDIYGDRVAVRFVDRIRDIARFDSVDALVHAMERDCDAARRLLTA
ncbi:MAG TPA: bifunctional riboflavin kinase/FAD synthetase [Longimicrobiales bacterium]|nr:bifunctional riboflavin kinase/FAD synthetase [Longimicrobiales bacterium]